MSRRGGCPTGAPIPRVRQGLVAPGRPVSRRNRQKRGVHAPSCPSLRPLSRGVRGSTTSSVGWMGPRRAPPNRTERPDTRRASPISAAGPGTLFGPAALPLPAPVLPSISVRQAGPAPNAPITARRPSAVGPPQPASAGPALSPYALRFATGSLRSHRTLRPATALVRLAKGRAFRNAQLQAAGCEGSSAVRQQWGPLRPAAPGHPASRGAGYRRSVRRQTSRA